jgi:hypothetical protein
MARLLQGFAKQFLSIRSSQFLPQSLATRWFREAYTRLQCAKARCSSSTAERPSLADEVHNELDTGEQDLEMVRAEHHVRRLRVWEEGFNLQCLPNGIFGFTHSPGHEDAPVFRCDGEAAFEIHKLPDGRTFLLGFVSDDAAAVVENAKKDVHLRVYPSKSAEASRLVPVALAHIVRYKDYPPRDGKYLEVQITRAPKEPRTKPRSIGRSTKRIRSQKVCRSS